MPRAKWEDLRREVDLVIELSQNGKTLADPATRIEVQRVKWRAERKKRHRRLYGVDKDYTEKQKQYNRATYRRSQGRPEQQEEPDVAANVGKEHEFGCVRRIGSRKKVITTITLSVDDMSKLLNMTHCTHLYKWITKNQFPAPSHLRVRKDSETYVRQVYQVQKFYTIAEARRLLAVYVEHRRVYDYYRKCHKETQKKFFQAIKGEPDAT